MDNLQQKQRKNTKIERNRNSRYIYQIELDKACFQHDKAYEICKDLTRQTAFGKIFCDKAFNIDNKF